MLEETGGREKRRKRIEMCYVHVPIRYSKFNHYVLQTGINKKKISETEDLLILEHFTNHYLKFTWLI